MNLPEGKEQKQQNHSDPAKDIETVTPENENMEPVPEEGKEDESKDEE